MTIPIRFMNHDDFLSSLYEFLKSFKEMSYI